MHHPVMERAYGRPVAEVTALGADDDAADVNVLALEVIAESPLIEPRARHAIVTDERVRENEDLPAVARVGHRLWVSNHPCVEDDLAVDVDWCAEGGSSEDCSVGKDKRAHRWECSNASAMLSPTSLMQPAHDDVRHAFRDDVLFHHFAVLHPLSLQGGQYCTLSALRLQWCRQVLSASSQCSCQG